MSKLLKVLKSKDGSGILEFIVIVSATALVAAAIFLPLKESLSKRIDSTVESYNGSDTITVIN